MSFAPARPALALLVAVTAGCSSSSDDQRGLHGGVTVALESDHTSFLGIFFDGPVPPMVPMDVRETRGVCKLVVPRAVSCSAGCPEGSVCTGADRCTPRPAPVNVGVLQVQGLGGGDRQAEPTAPTAPSYQLVPTLPPAACGEGDDVRVRASAFTLAGKCIAPLRLTSAIPIPVVSGQPMRIAWAAPARAGISRVHIELDISHHGGFKGQIECDAPDTGTLEVPEPLVTALVALGRAGYPTVKVTRASTGTAPDHPHLQLVTSSLVEVDVDTGVVSCGSDGSPPCRAGTTCRPDFTCQ